MTSPLRRTRRWFLAMGGMIASIGIAGCTGDDDDETPTPTPDTTPTPTDTPTPTPTPSPTPSPAEIQYESLDLSTNQLLVDEHTEIKVEVVNTGGEGTSHTVELQLDGEVYDSKEIELAPGEQETVQFTVKFEEAGEYELTIGELTDSLTVDPKPAEFEYTDLSIEPDTPVSQEPITVTIELENVGGEPGQENVQLYVEGAIRDEIDLELQPEEPKEVEFEIEFDEPGEYEIATGELSKSITVDQGPAKFEYRDLTIEPDLPEVDNSLDITVTMENVGQATGTHIIELIIDDEVEEEREVEIPGETEQQVEFEFTPEVGGIMTVEVEGLAEEIEVVSFVGGIIDSDTVWTAPNSPYLVQETVQIDEGSLLEIEPGAEIRAGPDMTDSAMFHLHGKLTAVGDDSNSISFDGDDIHTFFDVMGSTANTKAVLRHCTFTDTEQFWYPRGGATNSAEASIEILHCELINAGQWWIAGPKNDVTIKKNVFKTPGRIRTDLSDNVTVNIVNNTFTGWVSLHDNGLIQNGGSRDESETVVKHNSFMNMTDQIVLELLTREWADPNIDGRENFWDTTDHDVIEEMIYDANDDIGIENEIEYEPILEEPHSETPTEI